MHILIEADYALVTFSVGVLQNDDVAFDPVLPDWKQEAIQSINMVGSVFGLNWNCDVTVFESDRQHIPRYSFSFPRLSGLTPR